MELRTVIIVLCVCLLSGADFEDAAEREYEEEELFANKRDPDPQKDPDPQVDPGPQEDPDSQRDPGPQEDPDAQGDPDPQEDPDPQDELDSGEDELEVQDDMDVEAGCPARALSGQIIGGRASSIARHPYQVSMVINGNSFCGGFIVSPEYVLTAAHCVQNTSAERIRLRVGSARRDAGGRVVRVANVTAHPQYGRPRFDNDVAVLRLARPLALSRAVRPVRLPRAGQRVPLVRLTVSGWGLTAARARRIPRGLRAARVPVVPHWLCRLSYGAALTDNMFCGGHFLIGGVSSCQGDSGGPAVYRGTALGAVSFARGCALPLSPTVFTRLAAPRVRAWLARATGL